jgi:predicted permease
MGNWLESAWQDVRLAARAYLRRPLPWTAAVASLALGIGVNTAVFSAFDALFLKRLPVPAAHELVNVTSPGPKPGSRSTTNAGGVEAIFSYPLFREMERFERTGLAGLAAHGDFGAHLSHGGQATLGDGRLVSGGYFPALGIAPALGRLLTPSDDRVPLGHPVAVLSHQYWTDRFGASPAILNDTLVLNGRAFTVVGVAPRGFTGTTIGGGAPAVFVPLAMTTALRNVDIENRRDHWLYVFGRLAPATTREQAAALINVPFIRHIREVEYPALRTAMGDPARREFQSRRIVLEDGAHGQNAERAEIQTLLVLLLAITGCVLLIACANVANMLLARAADRTTETAVRLAIGASPGRLVRWLLTESVLLGLAGGLGALVTARLTVAGIFAIAPTDTPPFEFELNATVTSFALGVGIGTGLLFGIVPALQGVRSAVIAGLHAPSGRMSGSRAAGRFRAALATGEVALATALLAVAGLFIASLVNVARQELGIRPAGLATFGLSPGRAGYSDGETRLLLDRVHDTLAALPGVASVSATTMPLVAKWDSRQNLTVEGYTPPSGADQMASRSSVGEGFFRTAGIPLLAGREFTRADAGPRENVAIVNEAFVRKFRLTHPVVGKRFGFGQGDDVRLDIEIVGVVGDAKYSNLRDAPPPQFFLSYRQADVPAPTVFFYLRTAGDSAALIAPIRSALTALDGNLPLTDLRTMDDQIWQETRRDRLLAALSSTFAVLATVLAGIGLYAVVTYVVSRRWREFGIRLALGATAWDIRRSILADVGRIAGMGVAVGVVAALALGRLGEAFLFGLDGLRPSIVVGAAGVTLLVVFGAAVMPARRAGTVRAVEVLKAE